MGYKPVNIIAGHDPRLIRFLVIVLFVLSGFFGLVYPVVRLRGLWALALIALWAFLLWYSLFASHDPRLMGLVVTAFFALSGFFSLVYPDRFNGRLGLALAVLLSFLLWYVLAR